MQQKSGEREKLGKMNVAHMENVKDITLMELKQCFEPKRSELQLVTIGLGPMTVGMWLQCLSRLLISSNSRRIASFSKGRISGMESAWMESNSSRPERMRFRRSPELRTVR